MNKIFSYIAMSSIGEIHYFETAHEIAIFMWGRSASKWSIYQRVQFDGGTVKELKKFKER